MEIVKIEPKIIITIICGNRLAITKDIAQNRGGYRNEMSNSSLYSKEMFRFVCLRWLQNAMVYFLSLTQMMKAELQ